MADEACTGQSSIFDYIEDYHDLEVSFETLHYKEVAKMINSSTEDDKIVIISDSVVAKYKNDLQDLVETKTFDRDEIFKYKCNPWLLSYDLYDSVEYWHLLLDLNDMYSAAEFTRPTVKVYDETLPEVLDVIMMGEENFININEEEVNEALGISVFYGEDEDDD